MAWGQTISKQPRVDVTYPEDYGAKGDAVVTDTAITTLGTDDRAAIQQAIDAAGPGGYVKFSPGKVYRLGSTVSFDSSTVMLSVINNDVTLDLAGATLAVGSTQTTGLVGTALLIGQSSGTTSGVRVLAGKIVYLPYMGSAPQGTPITTGWGDTRNVGIELRNARGCELLGQYITSFEKAYYLHGMSSKGAVHNTIVPSNVEDNKFGFYLFAETSGWCNANTVLGGSRVSWANTNYEAAASRGIHLDRTAPGTALNNNKFFGFYIERPTWGGGGLNPPAYAIYANCTDCTFDVGIEGFVRPFIDASGNDFYAGGNIFRCGTIFLDPAKDLYFGTSDPLQRRGFTGWGKKSNWIGGGGGMNAEPILSLADLNGTAGNKMLSFIEWDGDELGFVDNLGQLSIGYPGSSPLRRALIAPAATTLSGGSSTVPVLTLADTDSGTTNKVLSIKQGSTENFSVAETGNTVTLGSLTVGTGGAFAVATNGVATIGSIADGSKPSPATGGRVLWNSTHKRVEVDDAVAWRPIPSGYFASATDNTDLQNVSTDTDITGTGGLGSSTLPAGTLQVGRTLRIKAAGFMNSNNTSPTITFRVKLGTTVIGTAGPITVASQTSCGWSLDCVVTSRVFSAMSGTVYAQGAVMLKPGDGADVKTHLIVNTSTTSVDTTASHAFKVWGQWSAANMSNNLTTTHTTIEQIY